MCCGQRRSQWQTNQLLRRPPAPTRNLFPASRPQADPPAPQASIAIRYLANETIRVQGLRTGRSYEFSTSQPVPSVDVRDASSLAKHTIFSAGLRIRAKIRSSRTFRGIRC